MHYCYHHNDLDGRASGAVVADYLYGEEHCQIVLPESRERFFSKNLRCIEVDYNSEVSFEGITPQDTVIIVDFTFSPEQFDLLLERTRKVVWIDHHKTFLAEKYDKYSGLKGIRNPSTSKEGFAGCVLTWQYFNPNMNIPEALELIGDRDTWQWKFGDKTKYFCLGMQIQKNLPLSPLWESLFGHDTTLVNTICEDGKICESFRDSFCKNITDSVGYETILEGWHNCFAVNFAYFGSETFGERINDYSICIGYLFNGRNFKVSLYSAVMDVSKVAVNYGGGGHAGAAGFTCTALPFMPKGLPR